MTISLTVMILEGTGDMQYVLPLMITVMSAKFVGDFLIEGLYDLHIESRHLSYLSEDENVSHIDRLHDVTVKEIMTKDVKFMEELVTVGFAYDLLNSTTHQCFPIVENSDNRVLCGTIARRVVCSLIKHKAFSTVIPDTPLVKFASPLISWETIERVYPHYPKISDLRVSEKERELVLDLRPYIDVCAYTLNEQATVQRTYRMFRTLGLRHLIIVDRSNRLKGIVTRANLTDNHVASSRAAHSFELAAHILRRRDEMLGNIPSPRINGIANGYQRLS